MRINMTRNKLAIFLIAVFLIGLAVIIYQGRPVKQMEPGGLEGDISAVAVDEISPIGDFYTLNQVASHDRSEDCWSAVGGAVYDLTTWIARHPGGARPIINMCGKDSTEAFNRQHGGSAIAQSSLILLKIGEID